MRAIRECCAQKPDSDRRCGGPTWTIRLNSSFGPAIPVSWLEQEVKQNQSDPQHSLKVHGRHSCWSTRNPDPKGKPSSRGSTQLLLVAWSYPFEENRCCTFYQGNGRHVPNTWFTLNCPFRPRTAIFLCAIWRFPGIPDFLLHFRTTPCTVTGSSLAELLMGRRLNEKVPRVTIPTDRISTAHCQQLLRKRDPRAKLRQKSMWMRSARKNTVTLWKGMRSCLTRAAKTNYRQVIQEKGNVVIIEDQEGNTKMRNTYEKSLSSQTLTLIPRRNRRVCHRPQMQPNKLNQRLQQSLPKILPSLLEQRKLLLISLFVRDSLPPGWKTMCVLSSHMFLTIISS